jgi:GNAT superfamily N-acetyltransferase
MLKIETCRTFSMPKEVRREVLDMCNTAYGQPFDALFDLLPPDGLHVMGREDDRLVAHLVITDRSMRVGEGEWLRAAYFDAVATHPDCRHRGYASALIKHSIALCHSRYDLLALATNIPALYEKHGFARWWGRQLVENENGVGAAESGEQDNLMVLPALEITGLDFIKPMTANWRPGGGY